MPSLLDTATVHARVGNALALVHHDRWMLGGLRDGRLHILADSSPDIGRRQPRTLELSELARRSLYERTPLTYTVVDAEPISYSSHWESHWPTLLYVPVMPAALRPVGLVMVGARTRHWYSKTEVGYVQALAASLLPHVSSVTGPLGRLSPEELRLVELIGEGLSDAELALALESEEGAVRQTVRTILQKLKLRSRRQIARLLPGRRTRTGSYFL